MCGSIKYLCPNCNESYMDKMSIEESKEPYTIYDPSMMGIHITTSVSTRSSDIEVFNATSCGKSGTSGFGKEPVVLPSKAPSEALNSNGEIILVPYKCPKCGHQESFDE